MKRKRTSTIRRFSTWLDGHKEIRDKLLGFGVSCCLHVLLLITLSLIAIGSGTVPLSTLLIATQTEGEESTLAPDAQWLANSKSLELPDPPTDIRPIQFELSDVDVSPPELQRSDVVPSVARSVESPASETAKADSRSVQTGGSSLDEMQILAAAGIQSRVIKAGGQQGEVQFALAWKDVNDVDLHVIAPSGEHISHQHRRSKCGGMLDVDMNVEGESDEPVENVRWLRNAPWGRYTILVNFFKLNSEGVRRPKRQSPYQLLAQLGKESSMREEVAGFGHQQVTVWRFMYIPDSFSSHEREQMLKQLQALQSREESLATPMLEQAQASQGPTRQRRLQSVVQLYPHTDAAIEALQSMDGEVVKVP